MSDLDALIAKVEGAKEGDEALDLAIFLALHPDDPTVAKWAKTLAAMDDERLDGWVFWPRFRCEAGEIATRLAGGTE